jgi:hypothetical protein
MNPIQNFWQLFQKENIALFLLNDIPKEVTLEKLNALTQAMNEYNKDLGYIIKSGTEKSELIITAHGNPYLFKEVELLVFHAPKLERWKITAFLQPEIDIDAYESGTDKPLEFYGISLRISEIYFLPLEVPGKPHEFGIKVLLKNYIVHKNNPRLREALYVHIEHLIGEKSFANDLSFIEIDQLKNEDLEDDYVLELYNLKFFIDSFEYD